MLDWDEEDREWLKVLLPLLRRFAVRAAQEAFEELTGLGVAVDWGLVNSAAVRWAQGYAYGLVSEINGTTRSFLQETVGGWLESGAPLSDLADLLDPMFGQVRSELIAATEVTRAFHEGNVAAWEQSGVVQRERWETANDELVCEVCGPLDGEEVELGGSFPGGVTPPAHPGCRCGTRPVVEI